MKTLDKKVSDIMQKVDKKEYECARQEFSGIKYFDTSLPKWLQRGVTYTKLLGLDTPPSKKILDIGCGGAWFSRVLSEFGHTAIGTDVAKVHDRPEYDITIQAFERMSKLLNADRRIWEVKAFIPSPDFGLRFDLITAINVDFAQHTTQDVWKEEEWNYFFKDLVVNQLTEYGKVWMILNKKRVDSDRYNVKLEGYFNSIGKYDSTSHIFLLDALKFH